MSPGATARGGVPAACGQEPWWWLAALLLALGALLPAPAWTLLVFAPVVEEIVFRLGLQEALLRHLQRHGSAGNFAANAMTAVAFAAAHAAFSPGSLACLTALPALATGRLYQQQRRVVPCIGLHALFNALWLLEPAVRA